MFRKKDLDFYKHMEFCLKTEKEKPLQISRQDAVKLLQIMAEYRISSKDFGYIMNNSELFAYPS